MSRYRLGDITLRDWNSWDRVPRDPKKLAKKIVEAVLGVTLGPVGSLVFDVLYYAATTAITYKVQSSLLEAKYKDQLEKSSGRLVNVRDPASPHQYLYGKVRKGGTIVYLKTSGENNKYLHMVIALAGHEVNSISDIYLNDEIVTITNDYVTSAPWNSKIYIKKYLGNQTTSPDVLDDGVFSETEIGSGIAYLYVRLEYDQDVFANGMPNVTAVVEGKKVYDPRDSGQSASDSSTWTYSANAALCVADYLRADYGLGDADYGRVDDTMLQAAANVCDEDITLAAGGTEKRYECHGVLSAENTPADNLGRMLTSCNGTIFWGSGKWKIKAGSYTSPVKDFTLDDLRSEINLKTRTSARDNFNAVQGTFADENQDWITVDYPQIKSTGTFLFEDGGVENILDLTLPFTTSSTMAQRLAKQTLFRSREQMALTAEFGMSAFEVQIGDIVRLTIDRYGFSNKEFEVVSWALAPNADAGDMRVAMTLQETSEAAFAWNAEETAITTNNTTLPKYDDPVAFGFTPVLEEVSYSENFARDLVITITSSNIEKIEQVEVELQRATDLTGALDATGLINREVTIEGLGGADDLFSTELIGSRKIGDIDNDTNVDEDDVDDYADYYFGVLSDSDKLTRIGELHTYMLERPQLFSQYLYSVIKVDTSYQKVAVGRPPVIRFHDISGGRYNIRVTPITKLGLRTTPVIHPNFEVPFSDVNVPAPKTGSVSINDISSVQLYWESPESQSLSHYEVRHSEVVHGATVSAGNFIAGNHYKIKTVGTTDFTAIGASSNTVGVEFWCHTDPNNQYSGHLNNGQGTGTATNVIYIDKTVPWVDKVARPANNVVAATKSGTYVVRAFSKAGTPSLDYLRLPLTSGEISNPYTQSSTVTRWASNSVDFSELVVFRTDSGPWATGPYAIPDNFRTKIVIYGYNSHPDLLAGSDLDLGSSKEARITFNYDFVRLNEDSKLDNTIDKVSGLWDNLGMLVDDLNDEIQADFQIIPYVDVDGAGFKRVTSNIVKGRYLRFKVEVFTKGYNATAVFRGISNLDDPITGLWEWTGGITCNVEY